MSHVYEEAVGRQEGLARHVKKTHNSAAERKKFRCHVCLNVGFAFGYEKDYLINEFLYI